MRSFFGWCNRVKSTLKCIYWNRMTLKIKRCNKNISNNIYFKMFLSILLIVYWLNIIRSIGVAKPSIISTNWCIVFCTWNNYASELSMCVSYKKIYLIYIFIWINHHNTYLCSFESNIYLLYSSQLSKQNQTIQIFA